jgi:BASS family bile acid:Na+ symporter
MEGLTDGRRHTLSADKRMKYISNLFVIVGFLVTFLISRFVGMSLGAMPYVSAFTIVCWLIGIYFGYLAFIRSKKAPAGMPASWIKVCAFVSGYSSLLLTLMVVFGYLFYPTIEKSFIAKGNAWFVMASLFVLGLAITGPDWKRIAKSPKVIGLALLVRWICLPLVAYVIAYFIFIKLIPDATTARNLAIGLVIVGVGPTGTTSNALTMIAGGDLAMSVTVTGLNTLVTPLVAPFILLLLVGSTTHMDMRAVVIDLLKIVALPVTLGSLLGWMFHRSINCIKPTLTPMAVIALGFVMMGTMSKGAATLIKQFYILPYLVVGVILFVVVGYAIGWFIPKHLGFNVSQRKAACFEIGTTNAAVTLVLALRHFGPLAVIVSILYGKIMVIVGATLIVPLLQRIKDDGGAAPPISGNTAIGERKSSV